ncbi:hypothetical protein ABH903_003639, partial [Brevibacterium epidermidis]
AIRVMMIDGTVSSYSASQSQTSHYQYSQ